MSRLPSALFIASALFSALFLSACDQPASSEASNEVVTVYSSRQEHLIKPLFDHYSAETGVKVRFITDSAAPLMERLAAEGEHTPADMFMTVDVGNLWQAAERGLFQPLQSSLLDSRVPEGLHDAKGRWYGLSIRARTIVYSTERVDPAELTTYEALAEPQWQGRLCLRTAKKVYNQSLVATMIEAEGEAATEAVVKGWVANLATDPFANDVNLMKAIVAGQCDVGLVNTYYFGRMQAVDANLPLKLFWPNQAGRGVHINLSGAGITAHAKNPQGAQALLEWLASPEAQKDFAGLNKEYPVNEDVDAVEQVQAWGDFKRDNLNVEAAGRRQGEAIRLMDRAGYR